MKIVQGIFLLCIGMLVGVVSTMLSGAVQYPLGNAIERISPSNHVPESDIQVLGDRVIIKLDSPKWASFADTNSMDPVFDQSNHAIQVSPQSPDDIQVGDIVTYAYGDRMIIHRVIEKGVDGDGWYFIVKGDNNVAADPGKIRFEQIKRVVVAIIY